jgi:hypothetical protein
MRACSSATSSWTCGSLAALILVIALATGIGVYGGRSDRMPRRCRTSVQRSLLPGEAARARPGLTCGVPARWCHLWVSAALVPAGVWARKVPPACWVTVAASWRHISLTAKHVKLASVPSPSAAAAKSAHTSHRALASSYRSQVAVPTASAAACLTWTRPSVSVRWRPLLAMAIVTHLVTRLLASRHQYR